MHKIDFNNIECHAHDFANLIVRRRGSIHRVLRQYQSKEVVDDEICRTVEMLNSIHELKEYFSGKENQISVFLPLNLPLYSFALFAAIPSYQARYLIVRAPEKMTTIFRELCKALSLDSIFKNISFFEGGRQDFLDEYCVKSDVIIFTGKYENFVKIRELCGKKTLILFNGVGHNPILVTETANIENAVEKTLHVKLFNNGQDCAGPDMILVHSTVVGRFLNLLIKKLKAVRADFDYEDNDTRVGPVFEFSSLGQFSKIIRDVLKCGGKVLEGGIVDYKNNIIYPCVCSNSLRDYVNFEELYSPIFLVAEYSDDAELSLYFDDSHKRYTEKQMYVSVFGQSRYVNEKLPGTIPLKNISVHDAERGVEEYGGYGLGASAVSFNRLIIPKPILVPREIYTYILSPYNEAIKRGNGLESAVIEKLFKETVLKIFKENLVFAYIFGSYARNRAKSFSDIDTFVCVQRKDDKQIRQYLEWIFEISEVFGKIPDFRYPVEIVEFGQLENAVKSFDDLTLAADINSADKYDSMIWLHSLSHYKIALVGEIPEGWEAVFPANSSRILKSFLDDLREKIVSGILPANHNYFSEIPTSTDEVDNYINNLGNGKKLIDILKYIYFDEKPVFTKDVLEIIQSRAFFGRKIMIGNGTTFLDKSFRFGVV